MLKIIAIATVATVALSTVAEAKTRTQDMWAVAGVSAVVGGIVGALAAQPRYVAPQYAPVGVVPGINTVPGCYYAAFVDIYGRQFFRQICR